MKRNKTIFQQVFSIALSLVLSASLLTNVVYGFPLEKAKQSLQAPSSEEINPVSQEYVLNLAVFKTVSINYSHPATVFTLPMQAPSLAGILHKIIPSESIQFNVSTFLRNVFYVFISTKAP